MPDATVLSVQEQDKIYNNIRTALEKSVHKRLMTEVPYGVLLSGGLDSSLLAAIATRHMQRDLQSDDEDIRSKLL
jgi:asparagine synthase (glutamine-hydrolysing)